MRWSLLRFACEMPDYSELLETSEFARAVAVEDDEFDGWKDLMTRFGYRVDLIRERHVRVKDEAKIASRGTDWDDFIAER